MPETNGSPIMPGLNLAVGMATPGHLSEAAVSPSRLPELPPPDSPASAGSGRPARPQTTILDGQRLRQLRRERGLSQEKLADQAGISLTTVARLEGQVRASCRGRTLGRLAAALGEEPTTIACAEPDHGRPTLSPSAPAPVLAVANTLPQAHAARGRDE
jgi:DNA-binding Xre family transcriptional regulator